MVDIIAFIVIFIIALNSAIIFIIKADKDHLRTFLYSIVCLLLIALIMG